MHDNVDPDKAPKTQVSMVVKTRRPAALDTQLVARNKEVSAETVADPQVRRDVSAVAFKPRGIKTHLAKLVDIARTHAHNVGDAFEKEKFIFGFNGKQDGLIFNPHPENITTLRSPLDYAELEPHVITERTLVTDRTLGRPSATITLWEKKAEPGKPHVFYFSGKTGHIADTGMPVIPAGVDANTIARFQGYERNAGLKFLNELAKEGAGFTAVTMSGYGNNKGAPGEKEFRRDIKALIADWMSQQGRPPSSEVVVAGYSLGTANAAIMASELTKIGEPPAVLAIANGFSSMIRRGKEFIDEFLKHPENPKFKKYERLDVSEQTIRERMLKHPFCTDERIAELSPETHLCVAYSSNDEMIDNSHSKRLIATANKLHQPLTVEKFEGCGHLNVRPEMIARHIMKAYEHAKSIQGQNETVNCRTERESDRMLHMHDGVYLPQKIITVGDRSWQEIADAQKSTTLRR